jgi:hypothetical protein
LVRDIMMAWGSSISEKIWRWDVRRDRGSGAVARTWNSVRNADVSCICGWNIGEEALGMRIYLLGGMRMVCPVGVVKDGHASLF